MAGSTPVFWRNGSLGITGPDTWPVPGSIGQTGQSGHIFRTMGKSIKNLLSTLKIYYRWSSTHFEKGQSHSKCVRIITTLVKMKSKWCEIGMKSKCLTHRMCFAVPKVNNSFSSSESATRMRPVGLSNGQGNNSHPLSYIFNGFPLQF